MTHILYIKITFIFISIINLSACYGSTTIRCSSLSAIQYAVKQKVTPSFEGADLLKNAGKYPFNMPKNFGLAFRGHNKTSYKLVPAIFRNPYTDESALLTEFMMNNPRAHQNTWDSHLRNKSLGSWLPLAQHYGVPTRLLDWTYDLNIAIYFALSGYKSGDEFKIYVLNTVRLNEKALGRSSFGLCPAESLDVLLRMRMSMIRPKNEFNIEYVYDLLADPEISKNSEYLRALQPDRLPISNLVNQKLKSLQNPIAFHPYYNSDRICEQEGLFTIHSGHVWPGLPEPKSLKKLNETQQEEKIYEEIVCTVDNPQQVMTELALHFGAKKIEGNPEKYLFKKFKLDESKHNSGTHPWSFNPAQ